MDFFGIGFGEVLLILIIALIIWGPRRLPEIAQTLGKTVRALRRAANDFTSQVTRELNIEEDIEERDKKEKETPSPPKQGGDHTEITHPTARKDKAEK